MRIYKKHVGFLNVKSIFSDMTEFRPAEAFMSNTNGVDTADMACVQIHLFQFTAFSPLFPIQLLKFDKQSAHKTLLLTEITCMLNQFYDYLNTSPSL